MTPYTMLHLAGAFFVLALMHFATWAAVRSQRVQLWLASSFLGFAVLSFSIGLTSREASAMIADTRPWLILGVLPSIPLPYTLLRVAWSLLDQPLTLWRRVMLGVALTLGVVRVLDVSWSVLTLPTAGLTAEALSRATAGLSLPVFWLLAMSVAGTWAVEAARLLKRRGAMATAVLAASEPTPNGILLPRGERPEAPAAYQQLRDVLAVALHPLLASRFLDAKAFQRGLEPV